MPRLASLEQAGASFGDPRGSATNAIAVSYAGQAMAEQSAPGFAGIAD